MAPDAAGFLRRHWGDLASVAGFIFAIYTLLRIRSAAEQAKDVAIGIRERLTRVNVVVEFAAALEIVEEIKRLHRAGAWEISLDRYSAVRRLLVSIQRSSSKITGDQMAILEKSIDRFRTMEQVVERGRSKNPQEIPDLARLNKSEWCYDLHTTGG